MAASHVADYDSGAITSSSVASWAVSGVGVAVGDTLVVGVTYGGLGTATNRTISLADNLGNTYTEITLPAAQWYATNSTGLRVFKCQVTNAGTATITATPSANCDYTGIIARKFTGGSDTEDGDNCALENSTTPASGSITTTVNGDIIVGFATNTSSIAGSITANNGSFTGSYTITGTGMVSQYQIQSTAGAVDSEPTVSTSANWISAIVALQEGAASSTLTQSRFRWRNDDGSETTATWAAAENTDVSIGKNTPTRLRVQVQSTGDKPSASYKLQYRKVGDSTWREIK